MIYILDAEKNHTSLSQVSTATGRLELADRRILVSFPDPIEKPARAGAGQGRDYSAPGLTSSYIAQLRLRSL